MASGWAMVESFHLPDTVPGDERIGKPKDKTPTAEGPIEGNQSDAPAGAGPLTDDTPVVDVELHNTQLTVPTVLISQETSPIDETPEMNDQIAIRTIQKYAGVDIGLLTGVWVAYFMSTPPGS